MGGAESKIYVENWPYNSSCGSRENVKVGSFSQNNSSTHQTTALAEKAQLRKKNILKKGNSLIYFDILNSVALKFDSLNVEG